jgi:hypothetical protein
MLKENNFSNYLKTREMILIYPTLNRFLSIKEQAI